MSRFGAPHTRPFASTIPLVDACNPDSSSGEHTSCLYDDLILTSLNVS